MVYHYSLLFISITLIACTPTTRPPIKVEKQEQLTLVQPTYRISSNHYADLVLDSLGYAYIAYFTKVEDGTDEIRITKLNNLGETQWTLGEGQKGRAMAIAIDAKQKIWVVGNYNQSIYFGEHYLSNDNGLFIAQFDSNGECLHLRGSKESALASDIAINKEGYLLIGGKMGSHLSLGDKVLTPKIKGDRSFLALFDPMLNCQWIRPIDAQIRRIRSHPNGSFFIGGNYYYHFTYEEDTIYTQDDYDQDAFLLQVYPNKKNHQLQTFGKIGHLKKGYRSSEGISEISINEYGLIAFTVFEDPSYRLKQGIYITEEDNCIPLWVYTMQEDGKIIQRLPITSYHLSRSISALVLTNDSTIWVSGKHYLKNQYRPFLYHKKASSHLSKDIPIGSDPSMLFRTMDYKNGKLAIVGHFKDSLMIHQSRIDRHGGHHLFYYTME